MKKVDINIVIMFVVGILIGFCVSYCTISFIGSYRNLSSNNAKESNQEGYVISFDDDKVDNTNNSDEVIDYSSNEKIDNTYEDINNNTSNNVIEDNSFNNDNSSFYENPVVFFENISNSNDENVLKNGFVSIVDFIFYDKEIGGYTFKELANEAKLKVMKFALVIDQKIESYFPGYKESISSGVKNVYSNVKGFVVELYLDTVSVICENNESICENAKNDFQFMKKSFGLTWDFIKSFAEAGTDKLKRWYEVFRA